jgi:hypothetical protein
MVCVTDFRSDRSESPEGTGRARRVWDAYARRVSAVGRPVLAPVLDPAINRYAHNATVDLLGFWMAWQLHGGFEGLVEFGMHPSTVWRKVRRFRQVFGAHPDDYRFPGVKIDAAKYWDAARRSTESD